MLLLSCYSLLSTLLFWHFSDPALCHALCCSLSLSLALRALRLGPPLATVPHQTNPNKERRSLLSTDDHRETADKAIPTKEPAQRPEMRKLTMMFPAMTWSDLARAGDEHPSIMALQVM